ncbi:hypothetical protein AAHE18_11G068400 [Arachis hypogaea]
MDTCSLSIDMYSWLALGHQTPFLYLCNKLAKRGHIITLFAPKTAQSKLVHFNLYPNLIKFVAVAVPHVDNLPPNAETTSDVPYPLHPLIMTAMDLTQGDIEKTYLCQLKADLVFYDFTHWMPSLATRLGLKAIDFCIVNSAMIGYSVASWLGEFKQGSVVYCCLGSECRLRPNLFQELLLGLELVGMPFLVALKPPIGFDSVGDALPEGFEERVKGRGIVYGGWIQHQLILEHPSVGCFITHCGSGSFSEALLNECQLVLLPNVGDQFLNARLMSKNLQVGVEVEKGEDDGLYTKESVCKAVSIVMDDENETSRIVKSNHDKIKEVLLNKD